MAARDDRRDDHGAIGVRTHIRAGANDAAANLMPKRQRQRVLGAHTIVIVTQIGVADPTTGDF